MIQVILIHKKFENHLSVAYLSCLICLQPEQKGWNRFVIPYLFQHNPHPTDYKFTYYAKNHYKNHTFYSDYFEKDSYSSGVILVLLFKTINLISRMSFNLIANKT